MPLGQSPVSQAQTLSRFYCCDINLLISSEGHGSAEEGPGQALGRGPHRRAPVVHRVTTATATTSEGLWSEKSKRVRPAKGCGSLPECIFMSQSRRGKENRDEVCACSVTLPSVATAPSHYRAQITRTFLRLFNSSVFSVSQRAPNQMWTKAAGAKRHDHIQKLKKNTQCLFRIVHSSDRSVHGMLSILSPK